MSVAARLAGAFGASLAVHGAALALLERLPLDTRAGAPGPDRFRSDALRAWLRAGDADAGRMAEAVREKEPFRPSRPTTSGGPSGGAAVTRPGVLSAPVYYPPEQLDERPLIKVRVEPQFPPESPVPAGRVVLRLNLGETGQVEEIAVLASEPAGVFELAALSAFQAARFTPGKKGGVPVKSALTLEVLFGAPVPLAGRGPAAPQ